MAGKRSFEEVRQRILREPNFLNIFLQTLAPVSPHQIQAIEQNPVVFLNLVAGGLPAMENPPITLSQEDEAIIQMLSELGYSKVLAIQAYFMCKKNHEMAANFLLGQ